ncbi:hypothetical protein J6590_099103 [Homalodisca vitripennis]|nr:hypothetical protein J6590_099103 [Homalodisca vitripennis]
MAGQAGCLQGHRSVVTHPSNTIQRAKTWETSHEALALYNRKVRTVKKLAWKKLCIDIDSVQGCARLQKLLAKNPIYIFSFPS